MEQENKKSNKESPLANFEPNVIAAFAYLFPFLTGIIFFALEKENRLIRFHSLQSILFWLAFFVASSLVGMLNIIYIGFLLQPVVQIGGILLWLFLMWKAYQKIEFELPYLGKIAKDQLNK